ncbi:pantetheine-phosphate adenylyltransferase [bacterium]|nr:pantetheine-phosphate adenylyltransferase [bacterium]
MQVAVYPGSFDPVTYGHIDVIRRANTLIGTLLVAVVEQPPKETMFSAEERISMVRKATAGLKGVKIDVFQGLLVEYVLKVGAQAIIRGLRALTDFEYEFQMALTNRKLCDRIETIFLMPSETCSYFSSSMIKEIARLGGDISAFVPPSVCEKMKKKFGK